MTTLDSRRLPMRLKFIALAPLAALGIAASPASAVPRTVCAEAGRCDNTTLQAAVDAAQPYDTIVVLAGSYNEDVVVPAGKDGLTLQGAQATAAADDTTKRPAVGHETTLTARAGTALRVESSSVTVTGFSIVGSNQGVWSKTDTSGLQVLNTVF